jgi:hypothetical protein
MSIAYLLTVMPTYVAAQNYLAPPKHDQNDPGHWYDMYCCHLRDCAPVIKWEKIENGWIITIKTGQMAILPKDYMTSGKITVKPSKDAEIHACITVDMRSSFDGRGSISCMYVPLNM